MMESSEVVHHLIFSALFVFAILWLSTVIYRFFHTAVPARQKLPLLLAICALNWVCDLMLLILNEVSMRDVGMYCNPRLCTADGGLTWFRGRALSTGYRASTSLRFSLYNQLSGNFTRFVYRRTKS